MLGNKMSKVNTVNAIDNVAKSLANTKPVTNALSLSDSSKKLVVSYAKVFNDEDNTKALLTDSLFADGFRSYHIVGATDEDKSLVALRNQIIQLIVSADPESAKLYNAEPKTLSTKMQAVQTVLKTKTVPTIIGNIKKALKTREDNLTKVGGKKKPATKEQMVLKSVKQAIKYLKECKNGYEGFSKDLEALSNLAVLKQVK
jgi:hypothetical protein